MSKSSRSKPLPVEIPASLPPMKLEPESLPPTPVGSPLQPPENIYADFMKHKDAEERIENSNTNAINARIRARDAFDDFDIAIDSKVVLRSRNGAREELEDVITELDVATTEMLRAGEQLAKADHLFATKYNDVEMLLCQLHAAQPQEVRNRSYLNATKSLQLVTKAAARIHKMTDAQLEQRYNNQLKMLPAGSDSHRRKKRDRKKVAKKEDVAAEKK